MAGIFAVGVVVGRFAKYPPVSRDKISSTVRDREKKWPIRKLWAPLISLLVLCVFFLFVLCFAVKSVWGETYRND